MFRRAEDYTIGLSKNLTPMRIFRAIQTSDIRPGEDAEHPILYEPVHEREFTVMVADFLDLEPAKMLD